LKPQNTQCKALHPNSQIEDNCVPVRFDEQTILFKMHDASRAGLTPSPTCPSLGKVVSAKRDVAVPATKRDF
jgi:hypothetical protein